MHILDSCTREGINAVQRGELERGRALLRQALVNNAANELAWLWMSTVVSGVERQRECLQRVLQINPHNQAAQRDLAALQPRAQPAAPKAAPTPAALGELTAAFPWPDTNPGPPPAPKGVDEAGCTSREEITIDALLQRPTRSAGLPNPNASLVVEEPISDVPDAIPEECDDAAPPPVFERLAGRAVTVYHHNPALRIALPLIAVLLLLWLLFSQVHDSSYQPSTPARSGSEMPARTGAEQVDEAGSDAAAMTVTTPRDTLQIPGTAFVDGRLLSDPPRTLSVVWLENAPFGLGSRVCSLPHGKALLLRDVRTAEDGSLALYVQHRECAGWLSAESVSSIAHPVDGTLEENGGGEPGK